MSEPTQAPAAPIAAATTDRDKLLRVAQELAEAAHRAAAAPGKVRKRLPVVATADAAGLVALMHDQLDQAIELRSAYLAEHGMTQACDRGCVACCSGPVVVGEAEAAAVALWLSAHPEVQARFLAAYPPWRAALGSLIEDIFTAEDRDQAARQYRERRVLCPFNEAGDCTIYEVRPALCRKTHALTSREPCSVIGGQIEYLGHPAVEGAYEQQQPMRELLHQSLAPTRRDDLLGKAVLRRLTSATAFPNQPCPCGSGAKQKRCCGSG
jgi:Fe-S-cluster containining protein